MIQFTSS